MKVKCPFCDAVSYSIVEYKTSLLGYLVAILSILVFGFLSIILMPFLVSLTKSAIHRCAKCLNEVKSNSYFGFSSLEDKVNHLHINFIAAYIPAWQVRYYSHQAIPPVHRVYFDMRLGHIRFHSYGNRPQSRIKYAFFPHLL